MPNLLSSAKLRQTDVVSFPGSGSTLLFVTAVGTGSEIKLTSWKVDVQLKAVLDGIAIPGFDVRLHRTGIDGRILVSAARRIDGNLWLTSWRVTQAGLLVKLQSWGYGDNAGIIVTDYGIAGRTLTRNLAEIVTSVVDQNHALRLVIWHVDKNGNIVGKQDSGPIPNGIKIADGFAPSISLQRGTEYAVNFKNSDGNITWQYWTVSNTGVPTLLGETAQRVNIQGASPGSSGAGAAIAALPLTISGQTIARLNTNVSAGALPLQLITYEHNRIPGIPLQYNNPFLISDNTNDANPAEGITLLPALQPTINAANFILTDGLFESVQGEGQGMMLGALAFNPPTPATGIGSVTKAMNAHLVLEVVKAGLISLDDCVELQAGEFGGLPDVMGIDQSFTFTDGRVNKIVGEQGQIGIPLKLAPGDQISLRTLLYMSILTSDKLTSLATAHYAAQALFGPGTFAALVGTSTSQGKWVQEMQARSEELSLSDSLYCDPSGRAHSTPQDQVSLWMAASLDPNFRDITSKRKFTVADAAAEKALCGVQVETFSKITNSTETYPGFQGAKGGSAGHNYDVDYVGSQLQCNQPRVPLRACISCLDNHARRLERPLFVAQTQAPSQSSRGSNGLNLLDYGYRQIFTPDRLADSGIQGGAVGDFALTHLGPVLNVSAGIVDDKKLEVCLWNTSEVGVQKLQCLQRTYVGLQSGPANVPQTQVDMVDVTSTGADADYLTGFKVDGKLRLDLWRVGPRPE